MVSSPGEIGGNMFSKKQYRLPIRTSLLSLSITLEYICIISCIAIRMASYANSEINTFGNIGFLSLARDDLLDLLCNDDDWKKQNKGQRT